MRSFTILASLNNFKRVQTAHANLIIPGGAWVFYLQSHSLQGTWNQIRATSSKSQTRKRKWHGSTTMQFYVFLSFKILSRKQTLIQDQHFSVIGSQKLRKKNHILTRIAANNLPENFVSNCWVRYLLPYYLLKFRYCEKVTKFEKKTLPL